MEESKNYYELMGLTPSASPEEIHRTYIKLAKQYHPDYNANAGDRRMIELNQIYEVLSNPVKKQEYDNRFRPTKTYDFTKAADIKVSKSVKRSRIKSTDNGKKYLNTSLLIILWAVIAYLALYFIVNISVMYFSLPAWLVRLFPM